MRTPTENGLRSIGKCACLQNSNVSRAECPQAKTTCFAGRVNRLYVFVFSSMTTTLAAALIASLAALLTAALVASLAALSLSCEKPTNLV